jgi:ERCC4-related helicase
MRSFHQFLTTTFKEGSQQSRAKMEVLKTPEFVEILRLLGNRLGRGDDCIDGGGTTLRTKNKVISPRFSITGAPQGPAQQSFFYSHPKLNKLEEVVLDHFRKFESQATIDLTGPSPSSKKPEVNTRVMIFSQYRESVQEISELLTQHSPLVRVMTFVGHGSGKSSSKGLTQKEQTEVSIEHTL